VSAPHRNDSARSAHSSAVMDDFWARIDADNDAAARAGTACCYCGRPGVGFSPSVNGNVCQTCADGISPLDPHGIVSPQVALGDLLPLKPRASQDDAATTFRAAADTFYTSAVTLLNAYTALPDRGEYSDDPAEHLIDIDAYTALFGTDFADWVHRLHDVLFLEHPPKPQ
jgi:hypothetical protein